MRITDDIEEFVFNGDTSRLISSSIDIECNTDIQMHTNKGAIGLRIDGVQNIQLNDIYIFMILLIMVIWAAIYVENVKYQQYLKKIRIFNMDIQEHEHMD